jgi:hypothetical protein
MDVLELTAVSAIVLDLLSGFQRPSRYRQTAPAGPAVVRVLERLRQADPQTEPPMRHQKRGAVSTGRPLPCQLPLDSGCYPLQSHRAHTTGRWKPGRGGVSTALAAPCQPPFGRGGGRGGPLGRGRARRSPSSRTRPRRQRSATRMARRSSSARSTSSFTTT